MVIREIEDGVEIPEKGRRAVVYPFGKLAKGQVFAVELEESDTVDLGWLKKRVANAVRAYVQRLPKVTVDGVEMAAKEFAVWVSEIDGSVKVGLREDRTGMDMSAPTTTAEFLPKKKRSKSNKEG